ncbi:hypothetical protein XBKB1_1510037 [Xenorhabdus bovienii str. kraussei Becker Underwood]|uniref:Uncharacterized protein n=1 Tax=Xenorhabdus bovienii str. kraussei Becker Underwood TaxID=1398204 RepID=A0A077PFS2_XENBV|nr:hypothetical protein XBKB1_1510037 [Xenorhabdus bovienii str. kraussei Becker Underwood]
MVIISIMNYMNKILFMCYFHFNLQLHYSSIFYELWVPA